MKYLFVSLIIIGTLSCRTTGPKAGNGAVDGLKTAEDVQAFLRKVDPDDQGKVSDSLILEGGCKTLYETVKPQSWYKADLDGNGTTDLLVTADAGVGADNHFYYTNAILDMKENGFAVKQLDNMGCNLYAVSANKKNTWLVRHTYNDPMNMPENKARQEFETDTFVYKFGEFIEFNNKPQNYSIEKIEYNSGACFGRCPMFTMEVNADRSAVYNAIRFNDTTGKFSATVDAETHKRIMELTNYINFPTLKERYEVGWTDDQTGTVTITYNNGIKKTIEDYGLQGTRGLRVLYMELTKLRDSQKWVGM